ncbi:MAG: deoxyhypusine synthase [Planctomycetota bacterium]
MPGKRSVLRKQYLAGPPVEPMGFARGKRIGIVDLMDGWSRTGAFNGGRLAEAAAILKRMIEENATIALTLSGAMVPAGMGGVVRDLIRGGFIDFVISTGANLYHDLHFALELTPRQGDANADDDELAEAGIERIYDVFITEEILLRTDRFVQEAAADIPCEAPVSSARVHHALGKRVLRETAKPQLSMLAAAAEYDVPVFTSSPGDSSIGMNLAAAKLRGGSLMVDCDLDVIETAAIVNAAAKNGVLEIGGGSPKNFYMQTQPMLSQILGIDKGGHDYFVQITTDSPQWGGLSGATPQEAISWGKISRGPRRRYAVVYCDATIAFPLLGAYVLASCKKRRPRRLYARLDALTKQLASHAKRISGAKGAGKARRGQARSEGTWPCGRKRA